MSRKIIVYSLDSDTTPSFLDHAGSYFKDGVGLGITKEEAVISGNVLQINTKEELLAFFETNYANSFYYSGIDPDLTKVFVTAQEMCNEFWNRFTVLNESAV